MQIKGNLTIAAGVLLVLLAASCGGGGGGGTAASEAPAPAAPAPSASGRVADGYVVGATVTLDANDDRVFDSSEPKTLTTADGAYAFPGQGLHMVRAVGGIDTSTNAPFVGELRAPPGASVLSPLTTLLSAEVESKMSAPVAGTASPVSAAAVSAAETAVKSNLGIASSIALLTTDPVAAVKASASDAAAAKLMQQNVAVQVMLQQTTRAVAAAAGVGVPTDALLAAIYKQATKSLAALAAGSASAIDLAAASPSLANTVVSNTLTNVINARATPEFVAALPASAAAILPTLSPASVAAVAAQTITNQVKAVASAPAATLVASASGSPSLAAANPALEAYVSPSLQVALSQMTPLLTQAAKSVNTPESLQTLATSVVSALNGGGASAAATAAAAINERLTLTLALVPSSVATNVSSTAIQEAQTAASTAIAQAISQGQQLVATGTTTTAATTTTTSTSTTTSSTTSTTAAGTATVSLDGLGGTFAAPASYDAASGGGRFHFTDSVATASFTRISNFGANDSIAITGGGTNHLIVANEGADVVFTVNINGTVSQITLVGVASPSALIGSLGAFNALGVGTVSYQ